MTALNAIPFKKYLIVAFGIAFAAIPLFLAEVQVLLNLSMYQFLPLLYGLVIYLAVQRWRQAKDTSPPRVSRSWLVESLWIVMAFSLLVVHAGLFGPWLGGAAAVCLAAAGICVLRRIRDIQLWDLWFLVVITMRLPLDLQNKLAAQLQASSSKLSSFLLDFVGQTHALQGNVIEIPAQQLFVDEACSGIVSIVSVIACSSVIAILRDRSLLHSVSLFAYSLFAALSMNVVRIFTIAAALEWFSIDWTSGLTHEVLGFTTFGFAVLLILSFDDFLSAFLPWLSEKMHAKNQESPKDLFNFRMFPQPVSAPQRSDLVSPASIRSFPAIRLFSFAVIGFLLGSFHAFALYANLTSASSDEDEATQRCLHIDAQELMPFLPNEWQIVDNHLETRETISELGRYSQVFHVLDRQTGRQVIISLDFPFYRRWHDVTGCYRNSGWTQTSNLIHRSGGVGPEFIEATFVHPQKGQGHLFFANLNEEGLLIAPPFDGEGWGTLAKSIIGKYTHARQITLDPKMAYQIQVWSQQASDLSEQDLSRLLTLFRASYQFTETILSSETGMEGKSDPVLALSSREQPGF